MDFFHHLGHGFGVAFTAPNLLYALMGSVLGVLMGVLPGIGPIAAIAMLLPSIYVSDPTSALIMLTCVYCGSQQGAAIATLLSQAPGESSAMASAIDGQAMARQGRAGPALAAVSLGAFFAGSVGVCVVALVVPLLAPLAAELGPPERVSLIVLALVGAVALASGSLLKAISMAVLGLLLAQIQFGADTLWGVPRHLSDASEQAHGMAFAVMAMGLFGLGHIIVRLARSAEPHGLYVQEVLAKNASGRWPTLQDFHAARPAVARGTALGALLGALPGGGGRRAAAVSYAIEKRVAHGSISFGRGDVRGVAGPESAHSAGVRTSFIPMLALGVPFSAVIALMIGALALRGIPVSPNLMSSHPLLFWGLVASMGVGLLMLLILTLPLAGLWIRPLSAPYRFVFPTVTLLCCIGVYTLRSNPLDVYMAGLFAVMGYAFHKLGCDPVPLLVAFLLGPVMEDSLRRVLVASGGDWSPFTTRPLSAGLLIAAALMVAMVLLQAIGRARSLAWADD